MEDERLTEDWIPRGRGGDLEQVAAAQGFCMGRSESTWATKYRLQPGVHIRGRRMSD